MKKICKSCGQKKDSSEFSPSQKNPKTGVRYGDGRRTKCRECHSKSWREYVASLPVEEREALRRAHNEANRKFAKERPLYAKASKANLHAKRLGATGSITERDVEFVWEQWKSRCWICGFPAEEIDHVRPINNSGGGTNTADNIRPICRECNQKRSHDWRGMETAEKEASLLKRIKHLLHPSERKEVT